MIVGYSRISTAQQDHALQLDALNLAGCERIFSDTASGAKEDRPELLRCLKFLKKGDVLVAWKLDRLGRSLRHLVNIVHDLAENDIGFRVLTGAPIDTTTASGKLIFGVFASLAEFERSLIRERVNAGIKAAKSRGVRFGRPSILTEDHRKRLQERTVSIRALSKELGVSKTTLLRAS